MNKSGLDSFDHVVVLMLENRSFDNLLGYLYEADGVPDGKQFAGLNEFDEALPVPNWAQDYASHPSIKPHPATCYHQPTPDPGEVYQHVNTQIYNFISEQNCGKAAPKMTAPFNIPDNPPETLPMTGFIKDYVNTLNALTGKVGRKYNDPDFNMYQVIMQCFEPEKVDVLSTLAKNFAVFDHWFCSVPSQTWCNRAFWHAGTSGGKVVNPLNSGGAIKDFEAMRSWAKHNWHNETLFDRMHAHDVSHAVYIEGLVSLTQLVNGFKHDNVIRAGSKLSAFKDDIKAGKLPQYAFIEPKFLGQHNDQHPSSIVPDFIHDDGPTKVGTVLLGEQLIWDVYNTIFSSDYRDNTLLIITHDEHGGCFDHVAPPNIPGSDKPGQNGFAFDRLGIRVPMVMVSAHIKENTIVNDHFEHCSFIKTMCEKWNMPGLTDRDRSAPSFSAVFSGQARKLWPTIREPHIPDCTSDADYDDDPLNDLQKTLITGAAYLAQHNTNQPFNSGVCDQIEKVGEAKKFLQGIQGDLNRVLK